MGTLLDVPRPVLICILNIFTITVEAIIPVILKTTPVILSGAKNPRISFNMPQLTPFAKMIDGPLAMSYL
jgi:hypothetical protein